MSSYELRVGHFFHVERPVIQAPIGSLASVELVSAVSNAGGLGSLALTWTEPEAAASRVAAVKARTTAPFVANFVLAFEPRALRAVLEAGVPAVTFSWGLPGTLVELVHSFGAAVGVQVGTLEGARRAVRGGCDFLICQGLEAGGHVQSSSSLRKLLRAVVAETHDVPVVAAGGLADGADIAEVMSCGASAAMLGTRFVASSESHAHPQYKALLLSSGADDTVLTACFNGEWPLALHRVLRNATLSEWEARGCQPPGRRHDERDVVVRQQSGDPIHRYDDTPPDAGMTGDVLSCCLYSGTGVGKITAIKSAGALVSDLWRDAAALLTG